MEEKALFGAKKRDYELKTVWHYCFLGLLIIGFLLLVGVLIIRILHLLIPESHHWLTSDQISGLDKFLFSGALGGLLGRHLNKAVE